MAPSANTRPAPFIVRPPSVTDAIGSSLRDAYERAGDEQDEFDRLLQSLNAVHWTRQ